MQLQEQLKRQEKFFNAKLTTEDNLLRLQAAVANMDYKIEVQRYSADEISAKIYTLTDEQLRSVSSSHIAKPAFVKREEQDSLKSLKAQSDAVGFKAEQADSSYYPSIVLRDTFGYTHYEDDGFDSFSLPGAGSFERVNTQNKLMLQLSMNIIDFSAASQQKQAIIAQQNALNAKLAYKRKQTDADLSLAKRAIERSLALLNAAKLSQEASNRTFEIVDKKYKARVVDYVKYLDALAQKTQAVSQYNRALGALEISYARYYYFAGLDIKEYVND